MQTANETNPTTEFPLQKNRSTILPESHIASLKKIEDGYWWYVARLNWTKTLIKPWIDRYPDRDSLCYADLGCGTSGVAKDLQASFHFNKVLLVDGDPNMLKHAPTQKPFQIVKVNLSQPFSLPAQPDIITCLDVMEHLENDELLLDQIYNLLPPTGLMLLSVPALPWLYSKWDRALGHHRRYSHRKLKELVLDAGFKILEISYLGSFLVPMAPYRLLFQNEHQKDVGFQPVPPWLNKALISLSTLERNFTIVCHVPFGTSLIVSAIKV